MRSEKEKKKKIMILVTRSWWEGKKVDSMILVSRVSEDEIGSEVISHYP